ncbi:uncharacterized protein LOC109950125 isoform X3 [Prunus persica]|uniref:uncharacterized protein LOC109950125 isoform X3 n=1 Tax=Prunus persica TaxID=3760 RepID=UPI0009AB2CCD|nr:uncharacterized protein LOC109950125 isoform X3 [Prunus persica]
MPMLTAPSTIVSSPLLPTAAPRKLSEKIICRARNLQSIEVGSCFWSLIYLACKLDLLLQVKISIKEKKSHEEIAKQKLPN